MSHISFYLTGFLAELILAALDPQTILQRQFRTEKCAEIKLPWRRISELLSPLDMTPKSS